MAEHKSLLLCGVAVYVLDQEAMKSTLVGQLLGSHLNGLCKKVH